MSPLRQPLADYLAVRRALGYKLARPEKLLGQFITYLEEAGAATVTTKHALAWATLPGGDASWHALRLSAVRGFATYLRTLDPATEIPPADLIPWRPRRATPYLYSDADITALIAAAAGLRFPLRAATYQTLIGLLAVTGMRVGEAIRLDRADSDPADGVLTIRDSKFGKSRLVPLHPTTVTALGGYLRLRDRLHPHPSTPAVFICRPAPGCCYCNVHATFQQLARHAGCGPGRPHAARAFMTSGTLSRSAACSTPTPPARTGRPGWPCCPPTSGTSTRPPPTGTCPPPRSCSPWPGSGSNTTCESGRDRARARPCRRSSPTGWPASETPARTPSPPTATPGGCCSASPPPSRQAALPARGHRPGRPADRRLPRPPRTRPGQQPPHPQRPAGRDPLAVPLRGAAPPRARRGDRPGAGHPAQALRQGTRHLPHRARTRGAARRPGPGHLGRAARPRPAPARRPDRAARLRAHRAHHRRRPPRHRRARLLHRQRPQTPDHPAHHRHGRGPPRLDGRTRRSARTGRCSPPQRRPAQPRRG